MNTDIIKFMFLMTEESLTALGKRVPNLDNYTNKNTLIDFSKDLNTQLIKNMKLTDDEINYIKEKIKPME